MNNLSWFLYFAEIIPGLGALAGVVAFLIALLGGVGFAFWTVLWLDKEAPRPYYGWYFLSLILFCIVSIAIPSKETIYLIAGSEIGEYAVQTPEAQEIMNDIHEVIKAQLQKLKE